MRRAGKNAMVWWITPAVVTEKMIPMSTIIETEHCVNHIKVLEYCRCNHANILNLIFICSKEGVM